MPKQGLTNEQADALSVRNQDLSPLLRLPRELRDIIFEYALEVGSVHFHFVTVDRVLSSRFAWKTPINAGAKWVSSLLRRTTICRQIRVETTMLPVKLNTFAVDISELVDMINAMPKDVRDEIRVLKIGSRFHYAPYKMLKDITALAKLPSLRKVAMQPLGYDQIQPLHYDQQVNKIIEDALRKWAGENVKFEEVKV